MSTRRARIKAVAALPQRRKNINNGDTKKNQDQVNELTEKIKSPKTQSTSADKHPESSPIRNILPSPKKSPRSLRNTSDLEKVPLQRKVPTPTPVCEKRNTALQEKTEANQSVARKSDVFVSPRARASPLRKRSPIVRTPVIDVDVSAERLLTPHKRLLELQGNAQNYEKIGDSKDNVETIKLITDSTSSSSKETSNIPDGYNSPSTPDTSDVMDGIVPLKPVINAPKPIDLLKSEIISENAEVLFDPIVPLPSPTKVRPKLRPVPRLGPMRRNSIPGSASESEDESRRGLHGGSSTPVPSRQRHDSHTSHSTLQSLLNRDVSRVRNDSVCSSVSQCNPQTPAPIGSPVKEKHVNRNRRQEVTRRMAALRRRKESIQRDTLTMYDLIFYNPVSNPIVPDQDEIKANEDTEREKQQRKTEPVPEDTDDSSTKDSAPVPQIKLGPNGEIVLDEQSLVIKQSEQRKLSTNVVREGSWAASNTTSRVYRRSARTAEWSDAETVRFYRALAALGTDFSLMQPLFPARSRRDLKLKFKKEEKNNLAQIDKALRSVAGWDANRLEKEFNDERKLAEEKEKEEKDRLNKEKKAEKERYQTMKDLKVKQSKASKVLGDSILPTTLAKTKHGLTADDIIRQVAIERKRKRELLQEKQLKAQQRKEKKSQSYASLTPTPIKSPVKQAKVPIPRLDMASIQKKQHTSPVVINAVPAVPTDIAPGSLVVLTVDDPKAPTQKAIHTYVKHGDGSIAPIILDSNVMTSLVTLMKKDPPKAGSSIASPSPGTSNSRTSTPSISASPDKRRRLNSYNITDL